MICSAESSYTFLYYQVDFKQRTSQISRIRSLMIGLFSGTVLNVRKHLKSSRNFSLIVNK